MCRSARSINVCERTDGLWGLPPEVMCRVQRGKTRRGIRGSAGVYCDRARAKMEILVYVLIAMVRKRLGLEASLYQILQILSLTLFEKMPILQALQPSDSQNESPYDPNQLILFDF